eukprot:jgi/Tetstr1/433095/TSEL_022427.t1
MQQWATAATGGRGVGFLREEPHRGAHNSEGIHAGAGLGVKPAGHVGLAAYGVAAATAATAGLHLALRRRMIRRRRRRDKNEPAQVAEAEESCSGEELAGSASDAVNPVLVASRHPAVVWAPGYAPGDDDEASLLEELDSLPPANALAGKPAALLLPLPMPRRRVVWGAAVTDLPNGTLAAAKPSAGHRASMGSGKAPGGGTGRRASVGGEELQRALRMAGRAEDLLARISVLEESRQRELREAQDVAATMEERLRMEEQRADSLQHKLDAALAAARTSAAESALLRQQLAALLEGSAAEDAAAEALRGRKDGSVEAVPAALQLQAADVPPAEDPESKGSSPQQGSPSNQAGECATPLASVDERIRAWPPQRAAASPSTAEGEAEDWEEDLLGPVPLTELGCIAALLMAIQAEAGSSPGRAAEALRAAGALRHLLAAPCSGSAELVLRSGGVGVVTRRLGDAATDAGLRAALLQALLLLASSPRHGGAALAELAAAGGVPLLTDLLTARATDAEDRRAAARLLWGLSVLPDCWADMAGQGTTQALLRALDADWVGCDEVCELAAHTCARLAADAANLEVMRRAGGRWRLVATAKSEACSAAAREAAQAVLAAMDGPQAQEAAAA